MLKSWLRSSSKKCGVHCRARTGLSEATHQLHSRRTRKIIRTTSSSNYSTHCTIVARWDISCSWKHGPTARRMNIFRRASHPILRSPRFPTKFGMMTRYVFMLVLYRPIGLQPFTPHRDAGCLHLSKRQLRMPRCIIAKASHIFSTFDARRQTAVSTNHKKGRIDYSPLST